MNSAQRTLIVVVLAFLAALAATVGFGVRTRHHFHSFRAENEPIRAWMSVPFIAHTHHVPSSVLFEAIGVNPEEPHDRRSLGRIARETNRPVTQLESTLQHAIDANQHSSGGSIR